MSRRTLMIVVIALLALAGCDPEKLLVWSSDGKVCAVIGSEGLHLADAEGNITPVLIPKAATVAWVEGTKRLAVQLPIEDAKWSDAEPLLEPERKQSIVERSERLMRLAKADPNASMEGILDTLALPTEEAASDLGLPALVYLRDHYGKELAERFKQEYTEHASDPVALAIVRIYDVSGGPGVKDMKLTEGPIVAASFVGFAEIRPAPVGDALALVEGGSDVRHLVIAPTDGKRKAHTVAELVARYPDWSADGKAILYARANTPPDKQDSLRLGSLRRLKVRDEQGKLLDPIPVDRETKQTQADGSTTDVPSPAEVLAGFIYAEWIKVRCLPSGRILFSGAEAQFPATAADMPTTQTIFSIDPGQPTISRALPRGLDASVPSGVHHFEPSPDGAKLAIPGNGGQLAVVNLATGQLTEIAPKKNDQTLPLIPVWRGNGEVSYAVAQPDNHKRPAEYALFNILGDKHVTTLSEKWDESIIKKLKTDNSEEEKSEK